MKVVTVVGARPQFIKAAVVSHVLRRKHQEILVHTGQHFDYNMSEKFFEELDIPKPDYNLGISGGTHAEMTGRMMMAIEKVLPAEKPDWSNLLAEYSSTILHILVTSSSVDFKYFILSDSSLECILSASDCLKSRISLPSGLSSVFSPLT